MIKKIRGYFSISLLLILLIVSKVGIADSDNLDFRVTENEYSGISRIQSFDIDNEGNIGVAYNNQKINIYNKEGVFILGYTFKAEGTYAFNFNKNNEIELVIVRGDLIFSFSRDGRIIKWTKHNDVINQYYDIRNNIISKKGLNFYLEEKLFSDCIYVADHNSERLLFKSPNKQITGRTLVYSLLVLVILAVLSVFILILIKTIKFKNPNNK